MRNYFDISNCFIQNIKQIIKSLNFHFFLPCRKLIGTDFKSLFQLGKRLFSFSYNQHPFFFKYKLGAGFGGSGWTGFGKVVDSPSEVRSWARSPPDPAQQLPQALVSLELAVVVVVRVVEKENSDGLTASELAAVVAVEERLKTVIYKSKEWQN